MYFAHNALHGRYYSNLSFDYGFPGSPMLTNNSLDSGSALFQWELARGLTLVETDNRVFEPFITSSSTFEAGTCILYMEMRVINAQVHNGIYSERTIRSTTEVKPVTGDITNWGDNSLNMTFTFTPNCQDIGQAEPCSLEGMKTVELSLPYATYINLIAAVGRALPIGNLTAVRRSGLSGGEAAQSLYRSPNITKTMHTVAHYGTVALRANDTILAQQNDPQNKTVTSQSYVAPSHRINGTVYVQAVYLRVRWIWLTLPVALALIVAGLLFETIRLSQSDRIGIWKNNPLALLFNTEWRPEREGMGAATSAEIQKASQTLESRVVQEGSEGEKMKRMVIVREKIGE
jgi:hypothetical protein